MGTNFRIEPAIDTRQISLFMAECSREMKLNSEKLDKIKRKGDMKHN